MHRNVQVLRLSTASMLVALTFMVEVIPTPPGPLAKVVGFTVIMSGVLLGPVTGAMVGCVSDLLGFMVHPSGPFFPGFTLTQALTGAIPGWLTGFRKLTDSKPWSALLVLFSAILFTQLITSVLMVSVFRSFLLGLPVQAELAVRLAAQLLHVPIYALAAWWLIWGLERDGKIYSRFWKIRR